MELETKTYYTLTRKKELEFPSTAKAFSLLFKRLHDSRILSNDDIDEILFECVFG